MRALIGAGTPKGAADACHVLVFYAQIYDIAAIIFIAAMSDATSGEFGVLVIVVDANGL